MSVYFIDDIQFDSAESAAEYIVTEDDITEEEYDEYIDSDGPVYLLGHNYDISYILQRIDPTAYRCGYLDYVDVRLLELRAEVAWEIESIFEGEEEDIRGYTVYRVDPDAEDEDIAYLKDHLVDRILV